MDFKPGVVLFLFVVGFNRFMGLEHKAVKLSISFYVMSLFV